MKLRFRQSEPARFRSRGGFTLIEVIATLVLSAILTALLLPLIGSGIQGSRRALLRMPETYSLRTQMDAWWQVYRTAAPTDLPALSVAIAAAAAVDPPPSYTVIDNGWVDFIEDPEDVFSESTPATGTDVLKVTLGNSQGERLTAYFFPIPFFPAPVP